MSNTGTPRKTFGWKSKHNVGESISNSNAVGEETAKEPGIDASTAILESKEDGYGSPTNEKRPISTTSNLPFTPTRIRSMHIEKKDKTLSTTPTSSRLQSGFSTNSSVNTSISHMNTLNRAESRSLGMRSPSTKTTLVSQHTNSSARYTPSKLSVPSQSTRNAPLPCDVLSASESIEEFYSVPDSMKELLEGDLYVSLPPNPERGKISGYVSEYLNIEELCQNASKMVIKYPTTKMRERIAEVEVILENSRITLKDLVDRQDTFLVKCAEVEQAFILYTLCLSHNRAIAEKEHAQLSVKYRSVIDTVSALNEKASELIEEKKKCVNEEKTWTHEVEDVKARLIQLKEELKVNVDKNHEYDDAITRLEEEQSSLAKELQTYIEKREEKEGGIRKKWESYISDCEQALMVIERDIKSLDLTLRIENEKKEQVVEELKQRRDQRQEENTKRKKAYDSIVEKRDGIVSMIEEYKKENATIEKEKKEKSIAFQRNEDTKIMIIKSMETKQRNNEEEIKILRDSIRKYEESYREMIVLLTKLNAENESSAKEIAALEQKSNQLQEEVADSEKLLKEAEERVLEDVAAVEQKKREVLMAKQVVGERNKRLAQLREDLTDQEDLYENEKKQLVQRFAEQQRLLKDGERDWLQEKANKLDVIKTKQEENALLVNENKTLSSNVDEIHRSATIEEQQYLSRVHAYQEQIAALQAQINEREQKRQQLVSRDQALNVLETKAEEGEMIRRRLHNTLQELRGSLRVIARIRPLLPIDRSHNPNPAVWCESDCVVCVNYKQKIQRFSYDGVFGFESTQQDVFNEVSNFVQSAVDGYNVCLFTYGQTGSGKTYTMQGLDTDLERGIIPRSIEMIIDSITKLKDVGWEYSIEVSYIEIYKEMIRDLLNKEKKDRYDIKLDSNNHPYITNITKLEVESKAHIHQLMSIASACRAIGATDMNDYSSRSHVVFTLYLQGHNEKKGLQVEGRLNLVDLAGSERLDKSHSTGGALEEAKFINRSLSALSNVFINIRSNSSHINFRDSKLTFLLKDCLSREGKTLMFVNLSPIEESAQESLCSLKFAATANQCKQGQAKRKVTKY